MRAHVISAMLCLATAPLCMAAGEPAAGAQDCAAISDATARLACFDAAAARSRTADAAAASASTAQSPRPASSAPSASSASSLGEEQLRSRSTDRDAHEPVLKARISEARRGNGGFYLLTLDNGHVWRHEQGSMAPYLKVGEPVTISPASLGSYRLTLDSGSSKNWIRVTRVR